MAGAMTHRLGFGARSEIINTGTVSGGDITFTGLDLSPYYEVRVFLSGIEVNADDNSIALQLEIGGSLVTSASYQRNYAYRTSADAAAATGSSAATHILLHPDTANVGVGTTAGESFSGWFGLGNPVGSKNKSVYSQSSHRAANGESVYSVVGGLLLNTGDVTGFKIYCPDGGGSLTAGRAFIMALA